MDRVVLVAASGKSVFDGNRYTNKAPLATATSANLLVLPAMRLAPETWIKEVPAQIWERAARGRLKVVFDASSEGREHDPERSAQLHGFLAARNIPVQNAVYLTQDRGYDADYQPWVAQSGKAAAMRVLNADYFIRKFFLTVEGGGREVFTDRYDRYLKRSAHRERRLISLNLSMRESKVIFLLRLMRDGFWDQAFVSCGGIGVNLRGKVWAYRRWKHEIQTLTAEHERLESMGRFLFGDHGDFTTPGWTTPIYDSEMPQHDESWFTVITETEMQARKVRVTEKPCKALVNFHPLAFLGNPGALEILREYGFRTFEGFFDERYDQISDPLARFDHVYDQVAELCRVDEAELARRTALVDEALVHNARWGLTQIGEVIRRDRDLDLIQKVMA